MLDYRQLIEKYEKDLLRNRRYLHQHPETAERQRGRRFQTGCGGDGGFKGRESVSGL